MPLFAAGAPAQPQEGVARHHFAHHTLALTLGALAVLHGMDASGQDVHEQRVAGVDEDHAVVAGGEVVIEFALGPYHSLERAKALEVSLAHVGDQSAGGLGSLGERLDVARVARTHLHHGNLMLGSQTQQRLGHAHVVVVVALGGHHAKLLRQHGTHKLLGSGLAIGASDAHHGDGKLATMLARQVFERLQRVRDEDHALALQRTGGKGAVDRLVVDHGKGAAFLQRLQGKLVAVERLALQGNENAALRAVTTVGSNNRMLLVESI